MIRRKEDEKTRENSGGSKIKRQPIICGLRKESKKIKIISKFAV